MSAAGFGDDFAPVLVGRFEGWQSMGGKGPGKFSVDSHFEGDLVLVEVD